MSEKTYKVDEQFILEAHKEACDKWKRKIEDKYPELFKGLRYFKFAESFTVSTLDTYKPIYVADGAAPSSDLRMRSLAVNSGYKAEIVTDNGSQFIVLKAI